MIYYAGIGNRDISKEVYDKLSRYALYLAGRGYVLRSGGAEGSDTAFEEGSSGRNEIFRAKDATDQAIEFASHFHPAWKHCNDYVKRLHGRNAMIILGEDLHKPVKFVLCYTVNESKGGTSLGIRIAEACNIPIINIERI